MPSWKFTAVSVPGDRHLRTGAPCADASAAVWHQATDTLILVAADGAGSAAHAAEGAAMAVAAVVGDMSRTLDEHGALPGDPPLSDAMIGGAVRAARERIERTALGLVGGLPPRPADHDDDYESDDPPNARSIDGFATTLLAVVMTPRHFAAVQIGDGYIVRITDQGAYERLFPPSRGRFANETYFLTSCASLDELAARGHVQTCVAPVAGTAGVALITDGLEPVAMDMRAGGVPHAPFFSGLVAALIRHDAGTFAGHVDRYLRGSAKVRERSDDDMTLVLALVARPTPAADDRRPSAQRDPALPDGRGAA